MKKFCSQVIKILNEKFIILFTLFVILLFSFISFFNFPSTDDFDIMFLVNKLGYWDAQLNYYKTWTGRFVSTAILFLFNEENYAVYRIFPIGLMILLFISFYAVVSEFFQENVKTNVRITCYTFLAYHLLMPTVSEGLYWWSGAITYQIANAFTLILIKSLIVLFKRESLLYTILGSFSGFIAVGCNETSLILICSGLFLLVLYQFIKSKKIYPQIVAVLVISSISAAIVYFAPGNSNRGTVEGNHNLLFSIVMSIADTSRLSFRWIGVTFLTSSLVYIEATKTMSKKFSSIEITKFLRGAIPIFIIPVFLSLFTGFWFLKVPIPVRATNTVFLYFLVLGIFITIYTLTRLDQSIFNYLEFKNTRTILKIAFISILFNQKNMVNAIDDVARYRVFEYKAALNERAEIVKKNKNKKVIQFTPLREVPTTIFIDDFKDKYYPYNICYARYLGVEVIEVCY